METGEARRDEQGDFGKSVRWVKAREDERKKRRKRWAHLFAGSDRADIRHTARGCLTHHLATRHAHTREAGILALSM